MRQNRALVPSWIPLLAVLSALLAGCEQPVPDPLDPDRVDWVRYDNEDLGFTVRLPSALTTRVDGNTVILSQEGRTAARIIWADRAEARNRGLWARVEPVEDREYGTNAGSFYRYRHWDGPSWVPTLAWVVDHRGRQLGVEFRTTAADLDRVQVAVLESLGLTG